MNYDVVAADAVNDDLAALAVVSPFEFALWKALIDLIWDNDLALAELFYTKAVVAGPPRFDTTPVWDFVQPQGLPRRPRHNVSRIKLIHPNGTAASDYRLLYAPHYNPTPCAYLLGLMPRDANYAHTHPVVLRCLADYVHFGIPHLSRH